MPTQVVRAIREAMAETIDESIGALSRHPCFQGKTGTTLRLCILKMAKTQGLIHRFCIVDAHRGELDLEFDEDQQEVR